MKWRLLGAASVVVALSVPQSLSNPDSNPVLQVGIIQRFGSNPSDAIRLSAPSGSSLTLTAADGTSQTVSSVTIGIYQNALTSPETVQRLILSSHRSFESAEASGQVWSELGVETELAQPDEWQVWAHRDYDIAGLAQIYEWAEANERVNVRWHQETRSHEPLLQWQVSDQVFRDTQLLITTNADRTLVNDTPYAGILRLQPNAYGNYTLVNTVPIETYLRGVVPHEIGYQAPQAAVEAQAILARTYALQNRHRFAIDNYELCADTQCQVYRGLEGTAWMADQAIASTAGQVLTYQGQLADAVYSSTTGGITAAFEHVWDGERRSYLQPVPDTLSIRSQIDGLDLSQDADLRQFLSWRQGFNEVGLSNYFRWTLDQPLDKLSANLRENQRFLSVPIPPFRQISALRILDRSSSGRVQSLAIDLDLGDGQQETVILDKDMILLGLRATYSLLFVMDPIEANGMITGYTFTGGGLGHGVGMSQIGSYYLARSGFSAPEILEFYYPGTLLKPLNNLTLALTP